MREAALAVGSDNFLYDFITRCQPIGINPGCAFTRSLVGDVVKLRRLLPVQAVQIVSTVQNEKYRTEISKLRLL